MIPATNTIPYSARPCATWAIIGTCVAVFLYQMSLPAAEAEAFIARFALIPERLAPTPFLTSMFLHGGVFHILSNLWTLWIFGPALEDRLGSGRYLALYIASGIAAAIL